MIKFWKKIFKINSGAASSSTGFTLPELLIVIFIVCLLTVGSFMAVRRARERAYFVSAKTGLMLLSTYVKKYHDEFGYFPADVNRGYPPGIERYFDLNGWPQPAWPKSMYDWENWELINDPVYPNGTKIYQISLRFCPYGDSNLNHCRFPDESWASNFGVDSAVYYCISGPCRSHLSRPASYPGYQIN